MDTEQFWDSYYEESEEVDRRSANLKNKEDTRMSIVGRSRNVYRLRGKAEIKLAFEQVWQGSEK